MSLSPVIAQAIRSGPVPRIRNWRAVPLTERTRAERNMTFLEAFCVVPDGRLVGQPVRLIEAQEALFYAIYDNEVPTTEAIWSIARKNSKTATIAFIVILHTIGPEARLNSEICSGARSREQAAQVFKFAQKTIQLSPQLKSRARIIPSTKTIVGLKMNVTYKALAAEASTSMGGSPVLTVIDEAGQIKGPTDDFVDAITTGQGAHDAPLVIVISTQAATDADWLSLRIDAAANGNDPSIVCHVYEAPKDCDINDRAAWQAANPALGIFKTVESVEKLAKEAQRLPAQEAAFRNLQLNQRVNADAPFVSRSVWDACATPAVIEDGAKVWIGLDLSATTDLTAMVVIAERGGVWQVVPTFWLPGDGLEERGRLDRVPYGLWHDQGWLEAAPGRTVDYEFVAERLIEVWRTYDVQAVAFDRWGMTHLKPRLVAAGFTDDMLERFTDFGQGFKSMTPALRTLETDLLNGRIAHGGHPVLTMCAANATVQSDPAGNRKLVKAARHRRIDGMIALTMARAVAESHETKAEIELDAVFL